MHDRAAFVSMAEQLPDGGIAVVAAGQKVGDGGNLVGLGGARGQGDCDKEDERKHAPDHQANNGKLLVMGDATTAEIMTARSHA
jgi:hypothetical protein